MKNYFLKKPFGTLLLMWVMLFSFSLKTLHAQELSQRLDWVCNNEPMPSVLKKLEQASGFKILFTYDEVQDFKVTVSLKQETVEKIVQALIASHPLTYKIEGKYITISLVKQEPAQRRNVTLRGKVVDAQNEPLPGASVEVKGASSFTLGTVTDMDGNFTLNVPLFSSEQKRDLVISFVGMKVKTIRLTAKNVDKPFNVLLESDNMLEEVVIVNDGYNRLPRKDMVGAFTTVKAEDIMMPAFQSVDQMLQGKIAGLQVVNKSSRVGASPQIKIRGTSTLIGNTSPLWVVDGVIQEEPLKIDVSSQLAGNMKELIGNEISWLNPNDIDNITVLKDASATAIYGSRASNGVIVITTKRGSTERMSVRYSSNFSIRQRPTYDLYDFMNSKERIQFSKEVYDVGARYQSEPLPQKYTYEGLMAMFNNRQITESEFKKQMQRLETVNTDWFDLLTRNSVSQNHNLSVSGGSQKVTYTASVGFSQNDGIEVGNENNQFTSRLNVYADFNKRLKMSFNINGSVRNSDGYGPGVNPYNYALNTSRSVPAFEENGEWAYYQDYYQYQYNNLLGGYNMCSYNIFNEMQNSYSKNKGVNFSASTHIDYKILDWLSYQATGSLSQSMNDSEGYAGEKTSHVEKLYRGYPYGSEKSGSEKFNAALLPFGGTLTTSNSEGLSLSMSHRLAFSKTFNEDHRVNAMLGWEVRSTKQRSNGNTVWGYVPERGEILVSPNRPSDIVPVGGDRDIEWGALDGLYNGSWKKTSTETNYMSFFGTLAYSLKNRYVFNFNVRSDASNRFGQDQNKKFDPTWSAGFSWKVAEEVFVKEHMEWLDQLNLRATYGVQGYVISTLSPELLARYEGILRGYNEYYLSISSLPNPYLKWEQTKTWNLGLDMQLFGLSLNMEYYGRRTNAINSTDVAQEYGVSRMYLNGGILTNQGLEVSLNFTPYRKKDFAWTIGLNFARNWNRSEMNDLTAKADGLNHHDFLSGNASRPMKKGYPLAAFWSFKFAGLDPETGYPLFEGIDNDAKVAYGSQDVDPTSFLVYSGSSEPVFDGGLNTRLRWKNFQFGADFAVSLGAKKRLPNPYSSFTQGKIPSPFSNISKTLNDRWKKPGDELNTHIPAVYTSVLDLYNIYLPNGLFMSRYDMWAQSDVMVADASYLRCTQMSLSYNFPRKMCQRIGLTNITLNANVNNLFVIASKKWNGYDPELGNSITPKVYSLGLSVGF